MSTVTNSLTGLSYLMQQGGPLSSLSAHMSPAQLQSAPSKDVVSLSMSALQTQQVDGLFGITHDTQTTLPALAGASTSASTSATEWPATLLPGVAAADLKNATPQEKSSLNNQALALQQAQALFAEPASTAGTTDLFA